MEIKEAIKKMAGVNGFDAIIDRAIVLAVDKNTVTCTVQLITDDDCIIEGVKLCPVENDNDLSALGIIFYPKLQSMVIIGQVHDKEDLVILKFSEIESIEMDANSAVDMLLSADGTISLNAVKMVFNGGKNAGLPLLKPLLKKINALEKSINDLADSFAGHTHLGVKSGADVSGLTEASTPDKITLTKQAELENTIILQ